VQAFARVAPEACVITKVDEAASLGAVISTTLRHKLKIAYICDGQRVPEDLHAAHQKRVWLVRAAVNEASRRVDQELTNQLKSMTGGIPGMAGLKIPGLF